MDFEGFGYDHEEHMATERVFLGIKRDVSYIVYISEIYSSDGAFGNSLKFVKTKTSFLGLPIREQTFLPESSQAKEFLQKYKSNLF